MRRQPTFALLALLLLVSPVAAQRLFRSTSVSPPPTPAATSTPVNYNIKVFYRSKGTSDWRTYGLYLAEPGMRLARHLQDQGYEVYAQRTTEPLVRNPTRPADRNLPVEQTITQSQADALFRILVAREEIAYRFPADGCYARTHLMVKHMQQMGLTPYKIWAFANGHDFQVATPNHPSGEVTWEYHVAPLIRVRGTFNSQRWCVLDPSLCEQPVTIEQWETHMCRSPYGLKPNLTITRPGEPVSRPLDGPAVGSGYWPANDPAEGLDIHAANMMRKFKPYEGRYPPKGYPGAVGWSGAAGLPSTILPVEPVANVQVP